MVGRLTLIGLVFTALLCAASLHGCHRDTEQERIRKIIQKVQKAAEKKDIRTILAHLSQTYADPQGNNRNGIKDLLLVYFFRYPTVAVFITDLEISVKSPSASATFQAVLTGNQKNGTGTVIPESLGLYRFEVKFILENGEWKVVSAQWQRLGDAPAQQS